MMVYSGNAVYDYIIDNDLDYFFCVEDNWILVYGDEHSIPRMIAYVSKTSSLANPLSRHEMDAIDKSILISDELNLDLVCVRFMPGSSEVMVWQPGDDSWTAMSYAKLRDLYEDYGVVKAGTAKKAVNQYVSSPYHEWQRNNLGRITVSDLDLVKIRNNCLEEIIELKRSKYSLSSWQPFSADYPNFALLINAIVGAEKSIRLSLYYSYLRSGVAGARVEDISSLKVYDFQIPSSMINCSDVVYDLRGIYTPTDILN